MKSIQKLSVVVSAFNAEKRLPKCLDSVKNIADEIIVVNNSSLDKTRQVALKYTDKVFDRPNNPMLNINKNYGFSKATCEWILNLDDDEQVTSKLSKELESRIKSQESGEVNGYWIPRRNMIFGKWIEHTGWYPDYQMRLFRSGKGKFAEQHIHEMIEIQGKTAYLTEDITHDNYISVEQFLRKLFTIYTINEAEQLIKKGYRVQPFDAIRMPAKEFIQRFFVQEGYKDGIHGLTLSLLMGFYHFIVFTLVWEKEGFKEYNESGFLKNFLSEIKKISAEFQYWATSAMIVYTHNSFKKIKLKIARRKYLKQFHK